MQEKIRFQAGIAEQIASTIRKIDGVLDADVQISFPDDDPLNPGATKQKMTASVYVKHSGVLDDPNAHLITRIKRLVAGSVNGLSYDNVTVIPDRARFSDSSFTASLNEGERPYVNVWSVIVAQSSLSRFRMIFFSFTFVIVLLAIALIWLIYKFLPVLHHAGGVKKLFSIHPLHLEDFQGVSPKVPEKKEKDEEENEDDEER
jgi:type III secretion protein J